MGHNIREMEIQKQLFQGSDPSLEDQEHLHIGIWGRQTSFDPYALTSFARDMPVMECLYDGLTAYRPGTWQVVPALAQSWELFDDEQRMVFNLRRGVQFHHGYGEFTAEDVVFTIQRFLRPRGETLFKEIWQDVERVWALGRYNVGFQFKRFPLKLWDMLSSVPAFIVSKRAWEDLGEEGFKRTPVGTGPYQMKSLHFGGSTTIERFQPYWGVKPRSQYITFKGFHSESDLFNSLVRRQIDAATAPFADLSHYPQRQDINVHLAPKNDFWFVGLNTDSPAFQDIRVRKAVCLGINRRQILDQAFQRLMSPAAAPLPKGMPGHWEDAPPQPHDPEKARALLQEANGPRTRTLRLAFPDEAASKAVARVVKENLENLGFRVEEILFAGHGTHGRRYDLFINFFHVDKFTPTPLKWFTTGSPWNLGHWQSKDYARLIREVTQTRDETRLHDLLIQAQKILCKNHWALWLSHGVSVVLYQKNVDIGTMQPDGLLLPWTAHKSIS